MSENNDSLISAEPVASTENNETTNVEAVSAEEAKPAAEVTENVAAEPAKEEKSFYDTLPDDLKRFESLKKFNSSEDLAKSYVELSNKLGKRFDDMSREEIETLNNKFGVPAEAKDYGLEIDKDNIINVDTLSNELKELGIPKHLGPKIQNYLKEVTLKQQEEADKAYEMEYKKNQQDTIDALKKEYGVDYQERLNLARKAIKHEENGDEIIKKLDNAGLGNDADIIKMFVKKGEQLLEDKILGEDVGSFGMKRSDAAEEIGRLMSDKDFINALSRLDHPEHDASVKKWEELHKIKAGLR